MIISYDYGHGMGQDRGAVGVLNEENEIRAYAPFTVASLMRAGHTLVNCTPPNSGMTLQESLSYRTDHANASGSQLHLCFHVNAFSDVSAHGAECEVASDNGAKYGQSILNEIVKLGFSNRGVNRPGLWVTKNTNMPCVLIEPFFCTNAADCKLYNASTLGNAIAKGVFNIIGGTTPPIIGKVNNMSVLDFQKFFNTFNITGYAKLVEDGQDGPKTQSARTKLKSILNYILN